VRKSGIEEDRQKVGFTERSDVLCQWFRARFIEPAPKRGGSSLMTAH
jgi:hypothetical protein